MAGIREIIKYIAAIGLYYSGLLYLYSQFRRGGFDHSNHVILMYHRVLDDIHSSDVFTQPGMAVSTRTFNEQMRYLKSKFEILTLAQLAQLIASGKEIKQPVVVITFDDGWRDNYVNAFPALKKYDVPATIFLTTDYIGTPRPFWFLMVKWLLAEGNLTVDSLAEIVAEMADKVSSESEGLAELVHVVKTTQLDPDRIIEACKELELSTLDRLIDAMLKRSKLSLKYWETAKPIMTWEEAMEVSQSGIEIGSHGCSHRILTLIPSTEISKELSDSKKTIESKLGTSVTSFSYPNGNFDDEIKESVRQTGYSCAVATSGRKENLDSLDCFALKRVAIHEGVSTGIFGRFSKAMFAWHIIRHSRVNYFQSAGA